MIKLLNLEGLRGSAELSRRSALFSWGMGIAVREVVGTLILLLRLSDFLHPNTIYHVDMDISTILMAFIIVFVDG
jgi:hypothetical protein